MVLIETLWNVKNNVGSSGWASSTVLIETLWNVKKIKPGINFPGFLVLIETLWNVKKTVVAVIGSLNKCINRNIVECKVMHCYLVFSTMIRINRNIVECKAGRCRSRINPTATY